MFSYSDLQVTRILPTSEGIIAFAKPNPTWKEELEFFIQPDGSVKGKTTEGNWLELGPEGSSFIKARVRSILIEQINIIYM